MRRSGRGQCMKHITCVATMMLAGRCACHATCDCCKLCCYNLWCTEYICRDRLWLQCCRHVETLTPNTMPSRLSLPSRLWDHAGVSHGGGLPALLVHGGGGGVSAWHRAVLWCLHTLACMMAVLCCMKLATRALSLYDPALELDSRYTPNTSQDAMLHTNTSLTWYVVASGRPNHPRSLL